MTPRAPKAGTASVPITLWPGGIRRPIGRRIELSEFSELVSRYVASPIVRKRKQQVPGFSLATFKDNRRAAGNVERVFAVTFDFDENAPSIKKLAALVSKLFPQTRAAIHTTFSHSVESPRLRVVIPLSRPVSSDEYELVWHWAARRIKRAGLKLDESTKDASRFWYLPAHSPGAPYEWRELGGKSLSVSRALRGREIIHPHRLLPVGGESLVASVRARPLPRPQEVAGVNGESFEGVDTFFGRACRIAGLGFLTKEGEIKTTKRDALVIRCPWANRHTSQSDDSATAILPARSDSRWGIFVCLHAHCRGRTTLDLLDVLPPKALEAARREHGAGLVRARIHAGWIQRFEKRQGMAALERLVLRCYPVGSGAPISTTVKIGSRAHVAGLDRLPIESLVGRRADLALRGDVVSWLRLVGDK